MCALGWSARGDSCAGSVPVLGVTSSVTLDVSSNMVAQAGNRAPPNVSYRIRSLHLGENVEKLRKVIEFPMQKKVMEGRQDVSMPEWARLLLGTWLGAGTQGQPPEKRLRT